MTRPAPRRWRRWEERTAHASLKLFAATHNAHAAAAYLLALITVEHVTRITTTESGREYAKATRAVLKAAGLDWRVVRFGEYMLLWHKGTWRWRVGTHGVRQLTHVGSQAWWRELYVAMFPLVHVESGTLWLISVGHLPASIQPILKRLLKLRTRRRARWWVKLTTTAAARTHLEGTFAWGRWFRAHSGRHPEVIHEWRADTNLPHEDPDFRGYMRQAFGAPTIWDGQHVQGTHPRKHPSRGIDSGGTRGGRPVGLGARTVRTRRARVTPPPGFDHWAVITVTEFCTPAA